jgi:hypothetical protein
MSVSDGALPPCPGVSGSEDPAINEQTKIWMNNLFIITALSTSANSSENA